MVSYLSSCAPSSLHSFCPHPFLSYHQVRLATDTDTNELVALKIMQKEWIWKNDMSSLVRREIGIMRGILPCMKAVPLCFAS